MDARLRVEVDEIFYEALQHEPGHKRTEFLDGRCLRRHPKVREHVERLLAADENAEAAQFSNLFMNAASTDAGTFSEPEDRIGPYKLLQKLGEGGMGVVYMAEQSEPVRRRVAVKLIKRGMDSSQVVARFDAERKALALMQHPNVAQIFDVGSTNSGRPYFVMELVKGIPITKYCDENELSVEERLAIFVSVCQAIQHAHQKGIVHRDLKPSNILVTEYDDVAVPKVIDFGLAKALQKTLTDRTLFTHFGQVVGTLEYMSPEQAKLNQLDIDTRTDIYSLGVLLYELVAGCTPFDRESLRAAAFDEMLRMIREVDPPQPSAKLSSSRAASQIAGKRSLELTRLQSKLRGDLDSIVMKALEKDRSRRYDTSSSLADDIKRFLNGDPVAATAPSSIYLLKRFARRHKTTVAATVAIIVTLISAATLTTMAWLNNRTLASVNAKRAITLETQLDEIRRMTYVHDVSSASSAWSRRNILKVHELLEKQIPQTDNDTDHRGIEWYLLASACKDNRGDQIVAGDRWCLSPDGGKLGTVTDESVSLIDIHDRKSSPFVNDKLQGEIHRLLCLSNDGERLVTRGADGLCVSRRQARDFCFPVSSPLRKVALSQDGKWCGLATKDTIQVLDVDTGKVKWSRPTHDRPKEASVRFLEFSQNSRWLIAAYGHVEREGVVVWEVNTGNHELRTGIEQQDIQCAAAFDERRLILGGLDGLTSVKYRDGDGLGDEEMWLPDTKFIACMALSSDRKRLAIGTFRKESEVWNLEKRQLLWSQVGRHRLGEIRLVNGGADVVLGSEDGVEVFAVERNASTQELGLETRIHGSDCMAVCGPEVAVAGRDTRLIIWNPILSVHRELSLPVDNEAIGAKIPSIAVAPDGSKVAMPLERNSGTIVVLNFETGELLQKYVLPGESINAVHFSPDGRLLAAAGQSILSLWDTAKHNNEWTVSPTGSLINIVRFSPSGKQLALGCWDGTVQIWDLERGNPRLAAAFAQNGAIFSLAWSPDSRLLVTGGAAAELVVYRMDDLSVAATLRGHSRSVQSIAFGPEGKSLFSGALDGTVVVWNVANWTQMVELSYDKSVVALRFVSADGMLGIVVGKSNFSDDPADFHVHWIDTDPSHDWSWLSNDGPDNL